jgi:hypothetical protein
MRGHGGPGLIDPGAVVSLSGTVIEEHAKWPTRP